MPRIDHFLALIMTVFSGLVVNADEHIRLNSGANNVIVNVHSICKRLSNSSSNSYFVPTRTLVEWNSFLTNPPSGVSAGACSRYDWQSTLSPSCIGGSGTWTYAPNSQCTGATGVYETSLWGACSRPCGVGGLQRRTYTCKVTANSGRQNLLAICNFNAGSGTQDMNVKCAQFYEGGAFIGYVDESYCSPGQRPPSSIACTPTDSSVCGSQNSLTQSCTPTSVTWSEACGAVPTAEQACNTHDCQVGGHWVETTEGPHCWIPRGTPFITDCPSLPNNTNPAGTGCVVLETTCSTCGPFQIGFVNNSDSGHVRHNFICQ